jgi:MFS family permease
MTAIPAPDDHAAGYAGALPRAAGSSRLGLALVVIASAQLMVVLDATIVNVALPHVQHALGFSGSGLEWVVNAYAVTFGGLLLLGGRAGDILGRRRVFVGCCCSPRPPSSAGSPPASGGCLPRGRYREPAAR